MPTTHPASPLSSDSKPDNPAEAPFHTRLREHLAERIGEAKSRLYFNGESGVQLRLEQERRIRVSAPTPFLAERLERGFAADIAWAAEQVLGKPPRALAFDVVEPAPAAPPAKASPRCRAASPARNGGSGAATPSRRGGARPASPGAGEEHRLDNFVLGQCNRLAHTAAVQIADFAADAGLRLLVLHGGCGLGKTHLLNGVARAARESSGAGVARLTGEAFTNRFLAALRAKDTASFRRDVRKVSALCIDDAQLLVGRSATLAEFTHTLDAVIASGGRAVVVLDQHPAKMANLPEDLRSRLQAGLIAALDPPDPQTRAALAGAFARRRGFRISEEALAALARTRFPSVRELQGVIARLALIRNVESPDGDTPVGLRTLRKALAMDTRQQPKKPPSPDAITAAICDALVVDSEDVLGGARHQRVVLARAMSAYLLRDLTTLSYPEIARALRRPNHSSIITAVRRVEGQIARGEPCDAGPRLGEIGVALLVERLRELVLERAAGPAAGS